MNVAELKVAHPMPWSYVTLGGQVLVRDAQGKDVQLFTMLDFVVAISVGIARADATATQPA